MLIIDLSVKRNACCPATNRETKHLINESTHKSRYTCFRHWSSTVVPMTNKPKFFLIMRLRVKQCECYMFIICAKRESYIVCPSKICTFSDKIYGIDGVWPKDHMIRFWCRSGFKTFLTDSCSSWIKSVVIARWQHHSWQEVWDPWLLLAYTLARQDVSG